MKLLKALLVLVFLSAFFSSCRVLRPNLMLKTPKDYQFSKISDTLVNENYRISPTDAISYRVFANDGFKLIDMSTSGNGMRAIEIDETVDKEGKLKMPLLGKVKLSGMTLRDAQAYLEKEYEAYYVKPFVQLRITNKRVIVFPGNAGTARVIPIENNNMTVIEAIAFSGGITEDGKAYKVKLIRRVNIGDKPQVYLMDLSTIDGIMAGNTTVLANDIIYVEPRPRVAQRLSQEVLPYLTLLSTSLTVYYLFTN